MNELQREVMLIAQEECAEVTQAISKVLRFGFDSKHPVSGISNTDSLNEEVGDLLCMINLMINKGVVDADAVQLAAEKKLNKLQTWSSHIRN